MRMALLDSRKMIFYQSHKNDELISRYNPLRILFIKISKLFAMISLIYFPKRSSRFLQKSSNNEIITSLSLQAGWLLGALTSRC